ncbi:hypothetical protein J7K28_04275 [Candidatus Aerophobetes bacterium]|nr:hypothetical protein [Candidatus Aerophobetes bacterium]
MEISLSSISFFSFFSSLIMFFSISLLIFLVGIVLLYLARLTKINEKIRNLLEEIRDRNSQEVNEYRKKIAEDKKNPKIKRKEKMGFLGYYYRNVS